MRPTPTDLQSFARGLRALAPISDAAVARITPLLRGRKLARGAFFLRVGQPATECAVVTAGLLREAFLLADGTERTKAFVGEGQSTGSLADLMSGEPSRAAIVAEEASRVLAFRYDDYRQLCEASPDWARVHLALVERLFVRKAEREFELLALDAMGRYRAILAQSPSIEQRVSAKHLASYFGITPVHLSRLRRARAGRAKGRATRRPR